jgi:hypothetical protein
MKNLRESFVLKCVEVNKLSLYFKEDLCFSGAHSHAKVSIGQLLRGCESCVDAKVEGLQRPALLRIADLREWCSERLLP